jgi:hypothetical protein
MFHHQSSLSKSTSHRTEVLFRRYGVDPPQLPISWLCCVLPFRVGHSPTLRQGVSDRHVSDCWLLHEGILLDPMRIYVDGLQADSPSYHKWLERLKPSLQDTPLKGRLILCELPLDGSARLLGHFPSISHHFLPITRQIR